METQLINTLFNYGIPSVLVFYLIFKFEKTINKNTEAVKQNAEATKELKEFIFQTCLKK